MPFVFPPIAAGAVTLISALTLLGWQLKASGALANDVGGLMAPNTALLFLFIATTLFLHRWKERRWGYSVGVVLAVVTGAFAAVTLFEHVSGINTGIDQILFRRQLDQLAPGMAPGRFAPNTAICFILLAVALVLSYEDKRKSLIEFLTAVCLLISGLAAVGHLYGVRALYSLEIQNYMAMLTATGFLFLGLGLLIAVAPGGWMGVVLRDDAAGLISRRIFVFSFTVVPFLGWVALHSQQQHSMTSEFATSLLVIAVLLIITSTVFRSAREIRRLERERRAAEDQLREAEKLAVTGRLAATLAHEVNNPLEAVTNILYLLDHDPGLSTQSKDFLSLAHEELSRVSHITRQTLAFYREPVAPGIVRPAELVRQTIAIFEPKLQSKQLRAVVADKMRGEITFFPGELKQIVTNLLSNAIDASEPGGTISIRIRSVKSWPEPRESGFRITIADNGSGILPADRLQLFQPFFTTKGQKGTGLGLWVTQGLVNKHGGEMRLRTSTRGQRRGTTFSIFLPTNIQEIPTETHAVSRTAS